MSAERILRFRSLVNLKNSDARKYFTLRYLKQIEHHCACNEGYNQFKIVQKLDVMLSRCK